MTFELVAVNFVCFTRQRTHLESTKVMKANFSGLCQTPRVAEMRKKESDIPVF
jgi:hypothetical protein